MSSSTSSFLAATGFEVVPGTFEDASEDEAMALIEVGIASIQSEYCYCPVALRTSARR